MARTRIAGQTWTWRARKSAGEGAASPRVAIRTVFRPRTKATAPALPASRARQETDKAKMAARHSARHVAATALEGDGNRHRRLARVVIGGLLLQLREGNDQALLDPRRAEQREEPEAPPQRGQQERRRSTRIGRHRRVTAFYSPDVRVCSARLAVPSRAMTSVPRGVAIVFAAALVMTLAMAAPVVRAPRERLFGSGETLGTRTPAAMP
jgi:hypothetical protein